MKVKAKCVGCGKIKEIGPDEVPEGDHPVCDDCMMPLIPISAERDTDE